MQKNLNIPPQAMPRPVLLDQRLIDLCVTKEDALRMCWHNRRSRWTEEAFGEQLNKSKAWVCRVMQGEIGLRGTMERAWQILCGNWAIAQFIAKDAGFALVVKEKTEVEALREEIERLKRSA